MKSKFTLFCVICLLSTATVFGFDGPGTPNSVAYNNIVKQFIDCHMTADSKKLDRILSDDATFKIPRGEKTYIQSKQNLIKQMKAEAGTQQNCESNYEILAESDAVVLARVHFVYGNTCQCNYLTIQKNADNEWKITQVYKFFKESKGDEATMPVTASTKQ